MAPKLATAIIGAGPAGLLFGSVAALLARQRADGSWANPNERWMEGEPVLTTAYALLALANCRK